MKLRDLRETITRDEWNSLAQRAGCNPDYLYLCALGHRNVSPQLAQKLVRTDSRLTLHELRPDIWEMAA